MHRVSIHVALNHVTHYRYDRLVALGPQVVRLRPAPHCRTRIISYSLKVTPAKHFINWQQDPEANYLARFVFAEKTKELRIEVDLVAEMAVLNPFDFFLEPYAETFPFAYQGAEKRDLAPYLVMFRGEPKFKEYLGTIPRDRKRTIDFLVELNAKLANDIKYLIRMEPGVQTPELTLTKCSGSCRDSAWLLVQLLRHMGLAARFVSGYLIQLTADMKSLDGPSGPEKDFTDLHAWCEVYLPGAGWVGLDPTSGLLAGEGHIPLACTPEPGAAAPVTGAVDKAEVEFEHHMKVERIWEAPRVTKPYTEAQWIEIEKLGHAIDAQLLAGDVRLTMGGEPTFVSVDDPDGAEWNTTAMGPDKRRLAIELYNRLKQKYAPQGLSHFGQGKWYPGEQLPRWSLNCFWRRDGEPIWQNPELLDDEKRGPRHHRGHRRRISRRRRRTPGAAARIRVRRVRRRLLLHVARTPVARRTSIRSSRSSTTRSSARAWREYSSRVSTAWSATCCRCRVTCPAIAGRPATGSCGASAVTWFRAIRRSASDCRSTPCRGSRKRTIRTPAAPDPMAPPRPIATPGGNSPPVARNGRSASREGGGERARSGKPAAAMASFRRAWRRSAQTSGDGNHAHRDVRRAAQRRALCVHAAHGQARGLPGARRGGRSDRRSSRHAGGARRIRAAEGSAAQPLQRDAGSGRHRGEHPSVGKLG